MRRIRSKLTYANVMATLAVFLVLGGGTAAALHGHNTVQSDDLGPGAQVKAADVASNAVNGANIADNSVTGNDVKESSLNGLVRGRMLDFNLAATGPGAPHTPIATVGPYKLSGDCLSVAGTLGLDVYANGPAGFAETEFNRVNNDTTDAGDHSQSSVPSANVDTKVLQVNIDSGFGRAGGTFVLGSNTGTIVQVLFSAVLDKNGGSGGACHVWGTATTG
ncbi:MAG: hypothetical protein ACRDLL_10970 [Solirubrobacterales bacterium]